jgi:hypothetical protein
MFLMTAELFAANQAKDGMYLVRQRPENHAEYVLGVMFKGKATHHLVKADGSGNLLVNNKGMGGTQSVPEVCSPIRCRLH